MLKRENMKDLILDGYWVNKKSGTIHLVFEDNSVNGGKKLWSRTTNLEYNRDYFFFDRFTFFISCLKSLKRKL